MKKQVIVSVLLILLAFMSGCKTSTTGKATASICDSSCQQERDSYASSVNTFLAQAQEITAKVNAWKTVSKEDVEKMTALRDKVSALKVPKDFDMVHDYYQRAFDHYVEAVTKIRGANEAYSSVSDSINMQARNTALTQILDDIQEANKLLIYADEEEKFATRIISKS